MEIVVISVAYRSAHQLHMWGSRPGEESLDGTQYIGGGLLLRLREGGVVVLQTKALQPLRIVSSIKRIMLCDKCRDLCRSVNPHHDVDLIHHGIQDFRRIATAGCRLCAIIHADLDKASDKSLGPSSRVFIKLVRDKGLEVSFIDANSETGGRQGQKPPRIYVLFQSLELPPQLQSTLRLLETSQDTNTGSDPSFKLALTWLDECSKNHVSCASTLPGTRGQVLPHRVIDVGPPDSSREPRLLETDGQTGPYLALSHCWGKEPLTRTMKSNYQDHRAQIKLDHLPRTFREAVHVTRKFKVRYLWIDSLCIVQDDEKDWQTESALMQQYYAQSLVTIAAADANNGIEGLFRQRDRLRYQACELDINSADGSLRRVYASTNSMSFEMQRSSLSPSFKPSPLYSRAWVLQEQLLSPRTISFFRDRMAWRCQDVYFDERAPFVKRVEDPTGGDGNSMTMGRDPRSSDQGFSRFQKKWVFPLQGTLTQPRLHGDRPLDYSKHCCYPSEMQFYLDWAGIVQEYTERSMTFYKDKLIALDGIASAVGAVSKKTYRAGIWVDSHMSTLLGLLWSTTRRKSDSQRLELAPSWSWASTTSQIMWLGHLLCRPESRIQIIDLDQLGAVANKKPDLVIETFIYPGRRDGDTFVILDWPSTKDSDDLLSQADARSTGEMSVALDENLENNTIIWFAELAAGVNHARRGQREMHCLVLVACGKESVYRRVGYSVCLESSWIDIQAAGRRHTRLVIV